MLRDEIFVQESSSCNRIEIPRPRVEKVKSGKTRGISIRLLLDEWLMACIAKPSKSTAQSLWGKSKSLGLGCFASERSGQISADGLVLSSLVFADRTTGPFLDSGRFDGVAMEVADQLS